MTQSDVVFRFVCWLFFQHSLLTHIAAFNAAVSHPNGLLSQNDITILNRAAH